MAQKIERATKYYAFLYIDNGESDDIDSYLDREERFVELAVGAVDIGVLSIKQSMIVFRQYKREPKIRKLGYVANLAKRQSVPPHRKTELKLLQSDKLAIDRQEALAILVHIANEVRTASGCESKNILVENPPEPESKTKNAAESTPQPTEKSKKKRKRVTDFQLEEAARMVADGGTTRQSAEKAYNLPQGALSKDKGASLVEEFTRKARQNRTVSKDEGDDLMYNEFR